jgi:hypothetical protein
VVSTSSTRVNPLVELVETRLRQAHGFDKDFGKLNPSQPAAYRWQRIRYEPFKVAGLSALI